MLADAAEGQLTIGTKYDQPGLALREPDKTMTGFDVEVAKYIANYLGVPESGITWREAPSAQRENLIKNGECRFRRRHLLDHRQRKKVIDFAGPYYVAGQSRLVRADDDSITGAESLQGGKKLCSVSGSTPAQKIAKS